PGHEVQLPRLLIHPHALCFGGAKDLPHHQSSPSSYSLLSDEGVTETSEMPCNTGAEWSCDRALASRATVGCSNSACSGTSMFRRSRINETRRVALREWPPRLKKLS